MRQLQPVLWTKGLLLTPQHLQTQDRYLKDFLDFRVANHSFCPRGFRSLEVDREALSGGGFALTRASGLFSDGLAFDIPEVDPAPDPKPLDEFWGDDRESMKLYLAIPEERPGGYNVSVDQEERRGKGRTRFLAEAVHRRDENTGASERSIQLARKNFRILTDDEGMDGHSVLPLARLTRSPSGEYRIDERFVPPVIDLRASEHLRSVARGMVELLSAKSASLSGLRRERGKGLADFGVSDVANFWLLYTVNSHLPEIRHIFDTRHGHPAELFETLLSLAGALTTFSSSVQAAALPSYDHTDLGGCFGELDEILRDLLETVIPSRHVSLQLERTEKSIFATSLDEERFFDAPDMYLAIRAGVEPTELASQAPQLVKVSSADRMEKLIKQALPGLDFRHAPEPPSSLPLKLDYEYFRLDLSGDDWSAIRQARNLAVYVPSDFPDPELELLVVLPREG